MALEKPDRRRAHRATAFAHVSFCAYVFTDAKGLVKKAMYNLTGYFDSAGRAVGILDLTEDLIFAKNHRVDSGGHAKEVSGGMLALGDVEILTKRSNIEIARFPVERGCYIEGIIHAIGNHVKLDAVAGRND
jgi:hypothetical protein